MRNTWRQQDVSSNLFTRRSSLNFHRTILLVDPRHVFFLFFSIILSLSFELNLFTRQRIIIIIIIFVPFLSPSLVLCVVFDSRSYKSNRARCLKNCCKWYRTNDVCVRLRIYICVCMYATKKKKMDGRSVIFLFFFFFFWWWINRKIVVSVVVLAST